VRTEAEILAQLEARYAEMEREAKSPAKLYPCETCKWAKWRDWIHCTQPLVMGMDAKPVSRINEAEGRQKTSLCGPEKALWEGRGSFTPWRASNHNNWWLVMALNIAGIIASIAAIRSILT